MKKYRAILNIGYKNENIIHFDKLTNKRFLELLEQENYILLYYSDFLKKYVVFDNSSKLNSHQKEIFNINMDIYCNEEV